MKTTLSFSTGKKNTRLIVLFLIIFLTTTAVSETYGQQGVGISESAITPHPSSILELQSTLRGFLAPRMTTSQRLAIIAPAQGLMVFDTNTQSFWYFDGSWKEIASTFLGSANQLFGMNSTATANEYKTLNPSSNITVSHTAGNIFLNTIQDIQTTSSPTFDAPIFNALTINGLTPNSAVYTNGLRALTTVPPLFGDIGYWNRNSATTTLSPSNNGDNIFTSGSLTANSIIKIGGSSNEFLKADGSVDNSTYLTGNQSITFTATGEVTGNASGTTNLSPILIIEPNAVTTAKIADNAVTTAKIADGAVTSAKILDGTIMDVDINANAAIAGTKISPDFGSQPIVTTGTLATGNATITGNIAVSGTVDGRDVALDGTNQDALQTLTGVAAGSTHLGTFSGSIISNNTTIKSALQELELSVGSQIGSLNASGVAFAPAGNISSTNVQAAIEELDNEKLALAGGTMSGNINMGGNNITNAGNITATGTVTANSISLGGSNSQFLKADGSADPSTYLTNNQSITFTASGDVTGTATGTTSLLPTLTIDNNAITAAKIADGAITTTKIADNAVTEAKIINDAITTTKIANNTVTTIKIADDAVTTAKIANDAVTNAKIADGAVTTTKITDNAVTTTKIVDNAVTATKIADGSVTSAKILDGTIMDVDINANAAIAGTKISPDFGSQAIVTTGTLATGNAAITGNIAVSGTVDGRNVALDGTNQDALQTLTGVGAGSVNLGTSTGSIIPNNATIQSALLSLETTLETQMNVVSFVEDYLSSNVVLPTTQAVTSITLTPGTWMITSETTIVYNNNDPMDPLIWNATVILRTASTVYTSGQGNATTKGVDSAITISLSKIVNLTSSETVSIFVLSDAPATVVNEPPLTFGLQGTATAIHAVRIK